MKQSLNASQGRTLRGRSLDNKILHLVRQGLTLKQAWKLLLRDYSVAETSDLPPCLTEFAKKRKLKP